MYKAVYGFVVAGIFLCMCLSSGCESTSKAPEGDQSRAVFLFDGEDLSNWRFVPGDPAERANASTLQLEDGVMLLSGEPVGVVRTVDEYDDYVLELEWRWAPGGQGGNSGLLVHCSTPRAAGPWPKSQEVQLKSENAGDFYAMDSDFEIVGDKARRQDRRGVNLTDGSENPLGEWNHMKVTCKGAEIMVEVNGDFVNHLTDSSETEGYIALQSEGAEIHFRDIKLMPLD